MDCIHGVEARQMSLLPATGNLTRKGLENA
jgi:hypothetical protein